MREQRVQKLFSALQPGDIFKLCDEEHDPITYEKINDGHFKGTEFYRSTFTEGRVFDVYQVVNRTGVLHMMGHG